MAAILQTSYLIESKCISIKESIRILIKVSLKFVVNCPIVKKIRLFPITAWYLTSHYLNQLWPIYFRPQLVIFTLFLSRQRLTSLISRPHTYHNLPKSDRFWVDYGTLWIFTINLVNRALSIIVGISAPKPRQNGHHFPDIFKWIFLNENVWISIEILLKFVPDGPTNTITALVQIMAWRRPGDKPLSEPILVSLLTHIYVNRPQWVKRVNIF